MLYVEIKGKIYLLLQQEHFMRFGKIWSEREVEYLCKLHNV